MTRPEYARGTLGEEVYRQLERDLPRTAEQPTEKTAALQAEREGIIWSIDTILPDAEIDGFEDLSLRLLPLWDDNTLPDLLRKLAYIYEEIANNSNVLSAWVRSDGARSALTSSFTDPDLLGRIATYPRLRDLTEFTVDLILEHDGLGPSGEAAPGENDFMRRLFLSLRDNFANPDDPTDLYRNVSVVAELMLEPDARFATSDAAPMWVVRPDLRGLPAVAARPEGGFPLPFVDVDGDGLADVDAQGNFIGADGETVDLPPFAEPFEVTELPSGTLVGHDEDGRAFLPGGQFAYEYVDLNETSLGYLLRRMPDLIERHALTDTFIALEWLLGDLDPNGEYPRYTTATPLLDLTDAVFQVAEFGGIADLMEVAHQLMRDYESTLASFLWLSDHNGEINDRLGAELVAHNAFVDDLLPYVFEIAQEKGLLDEVLTVLQDPMMDALALAMVDMNRYYNPAIRPAPDGPYETTVSACLDAYPIGSRDRFDCIREADTVEIFAGEVDWSRPDVPGNTSLGQRILHLIYDGSGVSFDMVITELRAGDVDLTGLVEDIGPILTIPDVVAAFFDSIAGNFCLADTVRVDRLQDENILGALFTVLEALGVDTSEENVRDLVTELVVMLSDGIGVHLDACPTPQQLTRFFNLPTLEMDLGPVHATLEVPIDAEGYVFAEHMADALYAGEATGMVDGLYPLFKVFSDRGLSPLLGELIHDLYRHYPDPGASYRQADGSPTDLVYSGVRRYEPALIEIFTEGYMIPLAGELGAAVQSIDLGEELTASDVLEEVVLHLLDPDAGVQNRRGETTATRGDGRPTPMTRYYLLSEAMDAMDERLASNPEADEAWDRASDELVDLMFDTVEDGVGRGRFEDPGSAALGTVATAHLERHMRRHLEAGDLLDRMRNEYPDYVDDLITSRAMAAAVAMFRTVRLDPPDQILFDDFVTYLAIPDASGLRTGPAAIYEFFMNAVDPIGYVQVAPFYAGLFDPERRFDVQYTPDLPLATHVAMTLRHVLDVDPDSLGIDLLSRAVVAPDGGESPTTILGRVIRQVHRLVPNAAGSMSVEDKAHLYTSLYEYIRDDYRGVERLIDIIQSRHGD